MGKVTEIDAIGEAIAETERDLFAEALDKDEAVLDETGDRSQEDMGDGLEGQVDDADAGDDDDDAETDEDDADDSDEDGEGEDDEDAEDDQPRDAKGKFAKKGAETDPDNKGKGNADDKAVADGKGQKGAASDEDDGEPRGRVAPFRLREQTARAKAAETERDAIKAEREAERAAWAKESAELRTRLDGILVAMRQPAPKPQEPEKPVTPPDFFENPQGFFDHLTGQFTSKIDQLQQGFVQQRVEDSMATAHETHGKLFEEAYSAVTALNQSNPVDVATVQRIWGARNPGQALVNWHREQQTLREVGNDPKAYQERIRSETREALMKDPEFRKELLASLRADAEGGDGGRPRNQTRLPKSLNGAAGGRSANLDSLVRDDSDRGTFAAAFEDA